MIAPLIFSFIFILIALVLGFLASRKIFRFINSVLTAVMVVLTIGTVALYLDARSIQEKAGDTLFAYAKNGDLEAGFIQRNQPEPVLLTDISAEQEAYRNKDYRALLGDRHLLFIAYPETFKDLRTVRVDQYDLDTEFVLFLLTKDDPRMDYAAEVRKIAGIPRGQEVQLPDVNAAQFKGLLFASVLNQYLKGTSLAAAINRHELRAYPQGITFWAMANLPLPVLRQLIDVEGGSA